jgi:rhomboid protease GluP
MAFGFTPKFEDNLPLNGLDPHQYIVVASDAAKQLGWEISYTSKTGFLAYKKSMWSNSFELKVTVDETGAHVVSASLGRGMYDWNRNEDNINELIDAIGRVKAKSTTDELNEKVTAMADVFSSDEEDKLTLPPATAADNAKSFLSLFIPRAGYAITPVIIYLNVLIFILMVMAGADFFMPDNQVLLNWGANVRPLVLEGQWWRLFTCTFLHAGIFHIALNMYALIYIGLLLEPYLGKLRFATAYIITGIIASLTSIYWHDLTVSVGASGAIFGMYGVFVALLTTNFIDKKVRAALMSSIGIFVVLNLINGAKAGIDNAAHIGGLVSGIIVGYAFYPGLIKPKTENLKYATSGGLFIAAVLVCFLVCKSIPDSYGKYQAYMDDFAKNENIALTIYHMPKSTPNDQLINEIENNGIPLWRTELSILDKADKLDLPASITAHNEILRQYCNLRIKSYELLAKEIRADNINKDSLNFYGTKIDSLINELKK